MDKKQTTYFREKLENISNDILTGADKTISEMTDHSDNYPDPTDRAAAESDRSFELRIRDRERKLLNKIKEAVERIDNGTYGICDECGDEIASERLEARPVTTYCIDCKTRQEQEEKSKA
jgi:DnaK suppressor protein